MPLHLLGKKSWNVYNQDNIARVRRDEAEAAAREAAEEQAMQEADARRRMRVLRGESVDSKESATSRRRSRSPAVEAEAQRQPEHELGKDLTYGDLDRRRKRRRGEDDTDRDIRYAKQMTGGSKDAHSRRSGNDALVRRSTDDDAPLHDQDGHIDLFPAERRKAFRARQREENNSGRSDHRSESNKKERPGKFDGTMRFSDAAGRQEGAARIQPWYRSLGSSEGQGDNDSERVGKDVWGNEDPRRLQRDKARMAADDPLAAMMRGVKQVREVEAERKKWRNERAAEIESMVRDERRKARHMRRSDRREAAGYRIEDVDVEEFQLDSGVGDRPASRDKGWTQHHHTSHDFGKRHRHRTHRRGSRDRERLEYRSQGN